MDRPRRLHGPHDRLTLRRDPHGVTRVEASRPEDLAYGLGWAHAEDRLVQMVLTRLIAQGRVSECLAAGDGPEGADRAMRRLGIARAAAAEVATAPPETAAWLEAYAAGVNEWLRTRRRPLELILAGHRPEPWRPADCLAITKVMSYVGLAQSQGDTELLIAQLLRRGVAPDFLQRLFSPHLDELDPEVVEVLPQVQLARGILPLEGLAAAGAPRVSASNNWVVPASRSATGAPLFAEDPHLEVNRLPAIWYEVVGVLPEGYQVGITMPGLPGLVMGRTARVAFGFTYGCMDQMDLMIERCQGGRYQVGDEWRDPTRRVEVIQRRGKDPLELEVFEVDTGVLEGDPRQDGYHLSVHWSCARGGAVETLDAMRRVPEARDVDGAMDLVREVAVSTNWLLADVDGGTGYQQAGRLPDRGHSGLAVVAGWKPEARWRGIVDPTRLLRRRGEEDEVLVSANDLHQAPGGPVAITLCGGEYRAGRIREWLEGHEGPLTLDDMQRLQADLVSPQARRYLARLEGLLPDTPAARALAEWDLRYDPERCEPTWFEGLYQGLMAETVGRLVGAEAWQHLLVETGTLNDLHVQLDERFFAEDPALFHGEEPDALVRRVAAEALADPAPVTWGEANQITMSNLLLAGKMPPFLGFDIGPVALPGGRATVCQGRVYRSGGRGTSFAPSWRFVADLGAEGGRSCLPGGASGSWFSGHYASDVERWRRFETKPLVP